MPTDEERRKMARRLRTLATHREVDKYDVEDAIGLYMGECVDGYDPVSVAHLADLIEPAPERTYHPERIGTAYHSALMCSACKYPLDDVTIYCPHCGARLEGVGR